MPLGAFHRSYLETFLEGNKNLAYKIGLSQPALFFSFFGVFTDGYQGKGFGCRSGYCLSKSLDNSQG